MQTGSSEPLIGGILKQEWKKSPAGTRQTGGKNLVWFGEIERKLAKISKTIYLPFFLLIILWGAETELTREKVWEATVHKASWVENNNMTDRISSP